MQVQIDNRVFKVKSKNVVYNLVLEFPTDFFDLSFLIEWNDKVKTTSLLKHEYAKTIYYTDEDDFGILYGAFVIMPENTKDIFLSFDYKESFKDRKINPIIANTNTPSKTVTSAILREIIHRELSNDIFRKDNGVEIIGNCEIHCAIVLLDRASLGNNFNLTIELAQFIHSSWENLEITDEQVNSIIVKVYDMIIESRIKK